MAMSLSEEQIQKYQRQIILPQVGRAGQQKLLAAKVLLVGLGGLGAPAAIYLARAGVGHLGLVDPEAVESSNLARQVLYTVEDIGKKKVAVAKAQLEEMNHDVEVVPYDLRLTSDNAMGLVSDYDIVVDGSDNFATRYLVNQACVWAEKPLVHGALAGLEGQVMVILPGQGPCYRCVFAEPPPNGVLPNCQQSGVLGPLAGVVGSIQAIEVLKLILGIGQPLVGQLLVINSADMSFRKVSLRKNKGCHVCKS